MTDYKLKAKINGKFFTVGNLKTNQWGNLQAGIKVTPELKGLVESNEGGWLNLSCYAEDGSDAPKTPAAAGYGHDDGDSIPF